MNITEIIGLLAGGCTTAGVIPQIVKALKTKEVKDVSPIMFIILLVGVGLWTAYGILKTDWPIIITNGLSFLLNAFMLILNIRYKKN